MRRECPGIVSRTAGQRRAAPASSVGTTAGATCMGKTYSSSFALTCDLTEHYRTALLKVESLLRMPLRNECLCFKRVSLGCLSGLKPRFEAIEATRLPTRNPGTQH